MKKTIFRILGALSSALIIVAVFVPFVSVTGFSQSLWQAHEATGTLYLPIMIIVFGAIGVIFFSINIKTELAYTSSGALLFFLIMQTIPIIDQGTFKSLSVGYYFLAIGTVLTGIMAFLCNLKTRKKETIENKETQKEISVINQLDKLYDNQASVDVQGQSIVDNVIQPLQIQPDLSNNVNQESNQNITDGSIQNNADVNVNMEPQVVEQKQEIIQEPVQSQELKETLVSPQSEISQGSLKSNVNPVVSEFSTPNINNVSNPGVSEFSNVSEVQVSNEKVTTNVANPVVSEFTMPSSPLQASEPSNTIGVQQEPSFVEPVNQEPTVPKVDVMANPTDNSSNNLDFFG